jgi:PAS domain S-box-containing protein
LKSGCKRHTFWRVARDDLPDLILGSLLADALEGAKLGVFVYDEEGRYIAVNRAAAELLGYPRDELLRRDVGDFTPGGMDRSVLQVSARREGVRRVKRRDGTEIVAAFVVVPARVSSLAYHLAIVWQIEPDDPRALDAE